MHRSLAIILFVCTVFAQTGWGQGNSNPLQFNTTEVYGTVVDASTKEPLPYVNIKLIGTTVRNNTDPKGHYDVRTIEKADSIQFAFLGYNTRTVPVIRGKVQQLNIELGSEELKLVEITVKAGKRRKHVIDTAANYVYYQVLKHKEFNRSDDIKNYRYDSYDKLQISLLNPSQKLINFFLLKPFKFVFNNKDTTEDGSIFIPGILKETIAKVYYRKSPKSIKKYVKAEIISGIDNPSVGSLANYQFAEIDPYRNLFVIANISFISPFSPEGINEYYYYLTDTAKIDGRVAYRLHFVGKVKEDAALKGYAWIDSATWAIRSIVFRPNEKANFNFVNDYTVRQDYTFINNKYWIMNRETLHTVGSALKKKNAVSLLITKVHTRRNIQADIEIPDSVFRGMDEVIIMDSARQRNLQWWDSNRFETLTKQEKEVYHITDTIKTVRAWKTYEFFGRLLSVAYADAGPISIGKILNFVSYNNVEGWRLRFGFETNQRFQHYGTPANKFFHKFFFNGYIAYGLGDRKYQYMALTRFMLPSKNEHWQSLEAMYRYDMRVPGQDPDQTLITFDNVINLISGTVLSKIMRTREFRITYEKEWFTGFSTITAMNYKIFEDIPSVDPFMHGNTPVPSFGVTEFYMDNRYSYHDQYFVSGPYRYFIATKYPVFLLRGTACVVSLPGDYFHFEKLDATIKQRLSSPIGHTSYILRAGKIFGKSPYTEAYMTQGNLGYIYDKFNYDLLSEFEFVSDQYVSLWVDHHFEGYIFNKIPGFNRLRLREIIFAKALIGSYNPQNGDVLTVPQGLTQPGPLPYVEAGFGIENILKMFRVDFVWRLTYRNLPGVPNWGVKFAFNPGF